MAKRSLFEQSQQPPANPEPSAPLATMPGMGSGFDSVQSPEQEVYGNYVAIMHTGKGKWSDVAPKIPGLTDGDAVLFRDGEPEKISPLVFFLMDIFQYWNVKNSDHKPRKTWLAKPESDTFEGSKIIESLSVAILLLKGSELIPATFRVEKAMCRGMYAAKDAVQLAQSPEWAKQSPDHAATLSIAQPNLRYKTELTWRKKPGRGGFAYFISSAKIHPTTIGDGALFAKSQADERFAEKFAAMQESFNAHKEEIAKLR